jgi:hypothetical protein
MIDRFFGIDRLLFVSPGDKFDILEWGNANRQDCLSLFQPTVRYLPIPASSAAVERQAVF